MLIIPAIDLQGGVAVRLVEGREDTARVYDADPVARAESFARAGARRIHVVDLDGAFAGRPRNAEAIAAIARAMKPRGVEVEVGGGLRDEETIAAVLEAGARFAIAGTMAIADPAAFAAACRRFPGALIAGIDARSGRAATDGWVKDSGRDAIDVAREVASAGAAAIIYTDIARDGTGRGVNVEETERIAAAAAVPVIASGGVRDAADLDALRRTRVFGVIVGRAIYEGAIDLGAALAE